MYNNYGNSYATLKMCHFSCQLFIKKLNKNETKLAYKKYKANNGILNWNDFQKKLKENKYILNFD